MRKTLYLTPDEYGTLLSRSLTTPPHDCEENALIKYFNTFHDGFDFDKPMRISIVIDDNVEAEEAALRAISDSLGTRITKSLVGRIERTISLGNDLEE
jgi:hypothetical protein